MPRIFFFPKKAKFIEIYNEITKHFGKEGVRNKYWKKSHYGIKILLIGKHRDYPSNKVNRNKKTT
jgi:hypothetical protein